MLIVVLLSKKFNIGDPYLGLVGSMSLLLKNVGIGLASERIIFFIGKYLFSTLCINLTYGQCDNFYHIRKISSLFLHLKREVNGENIH